MCCPNIPRSKMRSTAGTGHSNLKIPKPSQEKKLNKSVTPATISNADIQSSQKYGCFSMEDCNQVRQKNTFGITFKENKLKAEAL